MTMLKAIALPLAALALTPWPAAGQPEPPRTTEVYKKTSQGNLEMILHFPPGGGAGSKRPAIVFFFGGGWNNGNLKQFESQADHLARRGMVAARADYRVKSRHDVTPAECVEDAKSAVRYLRQNASRLGIDPERIVASGGSAGGHIAACTGLGEGLEAAGEDRSISSRANALVLYNPVLQFQGVPMLMERIKNDETVGKILSPTANLTKTSPPTLLLYGDADRLFAQGQDFLRQAKEVGSRAELFTAAEQGHGFFNRPPWKDRTTGRVDQFLVSLGYLAPAR